MMQVWHLTPDAPRSPRRVSPGEQVVLHIGTWPIEPGQSVWVTYRIEYLGSWIDENASAPGVDLGTWIGEEEENRDRELLGQARDFLNQAGAIPETAPATFEALYMAEGSDWFWWYWTTTSLRQAQDAACPTRW